MTELYRGFLNFFEIVKADTPELLEKVYKIRYQVLCVEKRLPGFDAFNHPNQMEIDEYDRHSSHILLRYRLTGEYIGTVRLILSDFTNLNKLWPVQIYGNVDSEICDIKQLPSEQTAEISRFVVVSQFDRRKGDRRKPELVADKGELLERRSTDSATAGERRATDSATAGERRATDRRTAPNIALALMAGVVMMSVDCNIRYWLSVMDPALNRLLSYDGLEFNAIGPVIDYHGLRRPYYVRMQDVLCRMRLDHYDAWEVVTNCGEYDPFSYKSNILI